jgi:hypothetical protein
MHISEVNVPSKKVILLKLQFNKNFDLTGSSLDLKEGDYIGFESDIKLTFKSADAEQSILTFEQFKASSNSTETFQFSLNWWSSRIRNFDWDDDRQ